MAFRIEFSQPWGQDFYREFAFASRADRSAPYLGGTSFAFDLCGWARDYGDDFYAVSPIATTENGMITTPVDGLVIVAIPFASFGAVPPPLAVPFFDTRQSLRCRFTATAKGGGKPIVIADGTLTFGDR